MHTPLKVTASFVNYFLKFISPPPIENIALSRLKSPYIPYEMGIYNARKYDFKAKDCDELCELDIPFAIKEYLQNSVGQILKALHLKTWREWDRSDFSGDDPENVNRRKSCKAELVKNERQLFAGKQGQYIAKSAAIQPHYILAKTIPASAIRDGRRDHDLRVIIILWGVPDGTALTIYNNYLDRNATFEHFVYDGASTSKYSPWAVGLKGKGFILATSLLAQECDSHAITSIKSTHIGVGFNIGSRLCRAKYNGQYPDMLKVTREDLRPLTLQAFKQENPGGLSSDVDLYGRRADRDSPADECHSSTQEIPIVHEDDVCIHVVGLPAGLTKEVAFSGVYGIIDQPRAWRSPDSKFEIFEADTKFYHRDQFVPIQGPLTGLGVNYHGELRLTADRTEIVQRHVDFRNYKEQLKTALDIVVEERADLATLIMSSFLIAQDDRFMPRPASTTRASKYRTAFEEATRSKQPDLFQQSQSVFPYSRSRQTEDEGLIRQLGFVPWALVDWQMHVLESSGAYKSPTKHSEDVLLASEMIPKQDFPGVDIFNACLRRLAPEVDEFFIVNYTHSRPRSVFKDGNVFLAKPRDCSRCDWESCLCWIGPTLVRVMEHFTNSQKVELEEIFEVYDSEKGSHCIKVPKSELGDAVSMLETPESSVPIKEEFCYEGSDNSSDVHRSDSPGWNEDTEMAGVDMLLDHEKAERSQADGLQAERSQADGLQADRSQAEKSQEHLVNFDEIKTFTSSLVRKIAKMQTSSTWKTVDLATQHLLLAIQHIGDSAIFRRPQAEVALENSGGE